MAASSPICLMSKATLTKSWLWHRRLSHLNFGTINDLTRLDLVDGLPKFKYGKDHLCSACERGKSKKASHPLKLVPCDHSNLELLHMDLCGPMRDKKLGIMQQFSTARTPQQNGVVERLPTGSVVVPTGSVVTTGSVIVPAGSVIVPTGSVVTTGSVIVCQVVLLLLVVVNSSLLLVVF
ncbi:integrase, catalytic region, zinc finger, CCHC-type containing protein [Tanacetum coccineum]